MNEAVLIKELRVRLHGRHGRMATAVKAVAILGVVGIIYFGAISYMSQAGAWHPREGVFSTMVVCQILFTWLAAPALAANAITREKEQQTWEMILGTLLHPGEILLSKLAVRSMPFLLFTIALLPLTIYSSWGLGDARWKLTAFYVYLTISALFCMVSGIGISSAVRKSSVALSLCYLIAFASLIGTVIFASAMEGFFRSNDPVIMWFNPLRTAQAVLDADGSSSVVLVVSCSVYALLTLGMYVLGLANVRRLGRE